MLIRFGIWDHFERRPGLPVHEQYAQKIALLQAAERLGFSAYYLAEHHLSPLDLAPSPTVFLAALAQATQHLRIGSMVYILPLYHPVRLVQELCMLDNLSNGRLEIGVGRGIRSVEHEWFGINATEARERHDEILEIILNAMSAGNVGYRGRFYSIPDAPLDLLPVQKPHPPLWYAGGVDFAATRGLNFLGRIPEDVERYWSIFDAQPHAVNASTPVAGITKHVVIRETVEEAISLARRAWPVFQQHWAATSLRMSNGRIAPANDDFDVVLAQHTRLLIGTPRTIRDFVEQCLAQFALRPGFYFAPAFQWGDLSFEESLASLELFAAQVMPVFANMTPAGTQPTTGTH